MVRSGRSLVELLVAVMVMAVGLAAASAATVSAIRWTGSAAARQEMLQIGHGLLDSIAAAPDPVPGTAAFEHVRAEWAVDSLGPLHSHVVLRLTRPGGSPLTLRTIALPPPPSLSDGPSLADVDPETAS